MDAGSARGSFGPATGTETAETDGELVSARSERTILVVLAVAAGGLYVSGAFRSDALPPVAVQEVDLVENESDFPLDVAVPLGPTPARPIAARVVSGTDLFERGDWRGQPATADLDGDGHTDLVASVRRWSPSEPADGLFVWRGDGANGFTPAFEGIRRDMGYGGADIADVNADGRLDIAFSGHDTPPQVFLNMPDGTWKESSDGLISEGVVVDVALGDFDRDGHVDLVSMGMFPAAGGLFFFQGDSTGKWELREELLDAEEFGNAISAADIDGDGWLEVLAATSTGPRVWSHDGTGFVDRSEGIREQPKDDGTPSSYIKGSDQDLIAADFDGDGVLELVAVGMVYDGHDPLRVFRLDGDGIWQRWDTGLPQDEAAFDAAFAQIDGKGLPEIVLAGRWGMKILRASTTGKFEAVGRVEGTEGSVNVTAGDFDGDGDDEVVFSGFGGIRVLDIDIDNL
jgi:hypothetical protein